MSRKNKSILKSKVRFGYPCDDMTVAQSLQKFFVRNINKINPWPVVSIFGDSKIPVEPIVLGKISEVQCKDILNLTSKHAEHFSFKFYGTIPDIILQQVELIKMGYSFKIFATSCDENGDWRPLETVKLHLYEVGGFANEALHSVYAKSFFFGILGPASPLAMTGMAGKDFELLSQVHHSAHTFHVSGELAETTGHGLMMKRHFSTHAKGKQKEDRAERWMKGKKPSKIYNKLFRKKYMLELRLDACSKNQHAAKYGTGKTTYDTGRVTEKPIDISLHILYALLNRMPSAPASEAELAALKYNILKAELPSYLKYKDKLSDAVVVLRDCEHHLATILDFFHKVQTRAALNIEKALEHSMTQVNSTLIKNSDVDKVALKKLYERTKRLSLLPITADAKKELASIKHELKLVYARARVEKMLHLQIDEIITFAYTGELPDGIEEVANTDTFNDKVYHQAYQVIYFSRHARLPQAMTDEQLAAFKAYTQAGVMPEFLEVGVEPVCVTRNESAIVGAVNFGRLFSTDRNRMLPVETEFVFSV